MHTGKKRRLTIIECSDDLNTMIDVAKTADLVSLYYHLQFVGECFSIVVAEPDGDGTNISIINTKSGCCD